MGRERPKPLILDAGALVAIDRADRRVAVLLQTAREVGSPLLLPAGVLAQVWRDGAKQARLAALLKYPALRVVELGRSQAQASGELCGRRGTTDVVDASVVLTARQHRGIVLTSDPDDLRHLDPAIDLERV